MPHCTFRAGPPRSSAERSLYLGCIPRGQLPSLLEPHPRFHTDPTYPKGSFPSSLKGSVCSAEVPWCVKDITMPFTTSAKKLKSNPLCGKTTDIGECRKLTVLLTCPQSCPSCGDIWAQRVWTHKHGFLLKLVLTGSNPLLLLMEKINGL